MLKNYFVYTVQGSLIKAPLIRRLSDFITLRNQLKVNWPGIYIPGLPSSSEENKDKSASINVFSNSIIAIPYLFNTSEVKTFFSNTPDLSLSLQALPLESFEQIGDKYEQLFVPNEEKDFTLSKYKEETKTFKNQIIKAYQGIKLFNRVLITAMNNYNKDKNDFYSFLKVLSFHEGTTTAKFTENNNELLIMNDLKEQLINIGKNDINPYASISDSLENEEIETGALLETLQSLESIYQNYDTTFQDLLIIEERMRQMTQNKTNWMSYLSLKSPDEEFNELQKDKLFIEIEQNSMKKITKYSLIQLQKTISTFKQIKLDKYYEQLRMISEKTINNLMIYNELCYKINEAKPISNIE